MDKEDGLDSRNEISTEGSPTCAGFPADSEEGVHTSELSATAQETDGYTEYISILLSETQAINNRLETMTNLLIVGMVGIGLVVGILATNIFARYFTS